MKNEWLKWLGYGLVGLVLAAVGGKGIVESQLARGEERFNLVQVEESGEVEFWSFDPVARGWLVIVWPKNLRIRSRSVGSYQVGQLSQLGSYEGRAGEFVRAKVQGFMKVPVQAYLIRGEKRQASMNWLDKVILWWWRQRYERREVGEEELIRAGVLVPGEEENWDYQEGRLQDFLGTRVLDWGVGEEDWTVAIINESGLDGLGADVASFLENVGMDVLMVRNGEGEKAETEVIVAREESEGVGRVAKLLGNWFGWERVKEGETETWRAKIVIRVGRDAQELF